MNGTICCSLLNKGRQCLGRVASCTWSKKMVGQLPKKGLIIRWRINSSGLRELWSSHVEKWGHTIKYIQFHVQKCLNFLFLIYLWKRMWFNCRKTTSTLVLLIKQMILAKIQAKNILDDSEMLHVASTTTNWGNSVHLLNLKMLSCELWTFNFIGFSQSLVELLLSALFSNITWISQILTSYILMQKKALISVIMISQL